MPRRKRKKVEATEATDEAAKVDIDMGDAKSDKPSPDSEDSPTLPRPPQAAGSTPFDSAVETMLKLQKKAEMLRIIAKRKQDNARCAQRTCEYKMKRLDNGEKRNRRKGGEGDFKAAFRTYEAIIASWESYYKSEFFQRKAAEAETAAAKAEVAVWKIIGAA